MALPVSGRQAMEVDEMLQRAARQTFGESRGILIETSGSLAEPGIRVLDGILVEKIQYIVDFACLHSDFLYKFLHPIPAFFFIFPFFCGMILSGVNGRNSDV